MILALDLEGVLIFRAGDPRPRPGLYEFLEWARGRFARLVVFSGVAEKDFHLIARLLVESGQAPAWFAGLDFFPAHAHPEKDPLLPAAKDLSRVGDPKDVLLVEDQPRYVLAAQAGSLVRARSFYGEPDDELARIRKELELRLAP
jgi:beta-phosphoglucomutase-like phosphatase (HAD superfamily)